MHNFRHYRIYFSLDSKTTVSTWLDCSRLMSKIRRVEPFVRGNISMTFWPQNSHFFDQARTRKQVDVVVLTYNMEPGIIADRLKTTLWGNKFKIPSPRHRASSFIQLFFPFSLNIFPCYQNWFEAFRICLIWVSLIPAFTIALIIACSLFSSPIFIPT